MCIINNVLYYNVLLYVYRISHPHMVPLLGYSNDSSALCLVYPYMPLGSLDYHLTNPGMGAEQRLLIARDIASALHYLHTGCSEVMVHRDVKRWGLHYSLYHDKKVKGSFYHGLFFLNNSNSKHNYMPYLKHALSMSNWRNW